MVDGDPATSTPATAGIRSIPSAFSSRSVHRLRWKPLAVVQIGFAVSPTAIADIPSVPEEDEWVSTEHGCSASRRSTTWMR